jgi:hypothetical protein
MRKLMLVGKATLVAAVVGVVGVGVQSALAKPPSSDPGCNCLDVWMPVMCSDGNIYSNYCYASCAGASGCVPADDPW